MRRYILIFAIIWYVQGANSQSLEMNIKSYSSYYYNNEDCYITELTMTNSSPDTLVIWIVDSLKKDDEMQNILDYFFVARTWNVTLSNIIYDGNVSRIATVVGSSFIKELPPETSFTIFFKDSIPHDEECYSQFAKNNIVSVKRSSLSPFSFTTFPIWQQQLLYKYDNIILTSRYFQTPH